MPGEFQFLLSTLDECSFKQIPTYILELRLFNQKVEIALGLNSTTQSDVAWDARAVLVSLFQICASSLHSLSL